LRLSSRRRPNVNPQIIKRHNRRVRLPASLQVRTLHNRDTRHRAGSSEHTNPLSFVKLRPQRMLSISTGFTQSQIAFVRDLRYSKSGTVQPTRNDTPRTPTSLLQHQIA
jgi:hypothetical protein